jgi:hypothetical protein
MTLQEKKKTGRKYSIQKYRQSSLVKSYKSAIQKEARNIILVHMSKN